MSRPNAMWQAPARPARFAFWLIFSVVPWAVAIACAFFVIKAIFG